jgi:maltodextrin utilization protein YvdJ
MILLKFPIYLKLLVLFILFCKSSFHLVFGQDSLAFRISPFSPHPHGHCNLSALPSLLPQVCNLHPFPTVWLTARMNVEALAGYRSRWSHREGRWRGEGK